MEDAKELSKKLSDEAVAATMLALKWMGRVSWLILYAHIIYAIFALYIFIKNGWKIHTGTPDESAKSWRVWQLYFGNIGIFPIFIGVFWTIFVKLAWKYVYMIIFKLAGEAGSNTAFIAQTIDGMRPSGE